MDVPWEQALQVGGVGFGMVFALLVVLAIVIWITGRVFGKVGIDGSETDDRKKGD